jgi:hypothetical protein
VIALRCRYDEEAKELHFYYNGTSAGTPSHPPTEAVVPTLANLIELQVSKTASERNIYIHNRERDEDTT